MKRIVVLLLYAGVIFFKASAQDTTKVNPVSLSGFIDFYYQYDFSNPVSKERPAFLYNHKRHNEFNINLALLQAAYENKKMKAHIGLMAGNYPQYNLAAEPLLFRHIYEANISYSFSDKISMDAGILPSHIGLESAISKDNWTLSRSILAENSPYYETGIKLNYLPSEKWSCSFLVLNGWQNIQETNTGKAIGTQLQFEASEKWLFNSSTFLGNEKPDSARQLRIFHNFYSTYEIAEKLHAAFLFDIGNESGNTFYAFAFLLKYYVTSKILTAFRAEHYADKNAIIITTAMPAKFKVSGVSTNIDYRPVNNISFRGEARLLYSPAKIFTQNNEPASTNFSLIGSLVVSF